MRNLIPAFVHEQFRRGRFSGAFQAATLFADISGFTPLTGTLLQHRRDGAEVLGETLEAIFAPMVTEVHARGGLIPLFAGDAFTALFPYVDPAGGDRAAGEAALRAVETALRIQDLCAPGGLARVFSTRYGDFAIGVKVGVAAGEVRWGIPGHTGRRTFYFRGPGVVACAQAEALAAPGQVVVGGALLPHIGHWAQTEPCAREGYHCVVSAGSMSPVPVAGLSQFSREDLQPFVPDAVLDLQARAEFRDVCPVFISFEEPEDEGSLDDFVAGALARVEVFGGSLSQVEFGDKGGILVVSFGAPIGYEDNARRAIELLLACRQQDWPLRWRAGVTSGIAWAGFRGGVERCEYGLVGDVVNLAARLATAARWGETWASGAVRASLRGSYRFAPRGAARLKGKSERTPVWAVRGEGLRPGPHFHTGRMVGREAELNELAGYLRPIFDGGFGGLVTVHGDAGIGKSRLVHELRQWAEEKGARWLFCPADQILRQSLNPFKRFLRGYLDQDRSRTAERNRAHLDAVLDGLIAGLQVLAGVEERTVEALAGELQRTRSFLAALVDQRWEGSLYEHLEPRLRFDNMLAAFKTLILAECARQPVVIQLEDLHWLDDDSLELVRLLTRNVETQPLVLVGTSRYRDDGSRVLLDVEPGVPQNALELRTLRQEGVRDLAALILEGGISRGLAALLAEKTEGNPFFVEQLVLDLRDQGALSRDAGGLWAVSTGAGVEVPATIGAVLLARLDRLVAQVREVVQTAAVLGREFEVSVLSRMLGDDERVPGWVDAAEENWIWTALSEVRYLFRHALLRDAAYEMQLRARRRELHALAGAAIETLYESELAPHFADLAYHYGQAGEAGRERRYARLAGEQAASQFANDQARRHFSRALALTPEADLEARYDLILARAKVCELQADRGAQAQDLADLEILARDLDDDRKRAEVALCRADYGESTGDFAASRESAREAVRLAQAAGDASMEAMGYRQWGRAHWRQAEHDAAKPLLQIALEQARDAGLTAVEAETVHDLGLIAVHQGAGAMDYLERALALFAALADRRGEGRARNSLGLALRTAGDYDRALAYHEQSLGMFREIGDRRGEAMVLNNLGNICRTRGEVERARSYYDQAVETQREIGDRWNAAVSLNNLGNCYRDVGDYGAAETIHCEALALHREVGNRHGEDIALENLGNDLLQQGDYERARGYFQQSLEVCREVGDSKGMVYEHCYLGVVARSVGDYDEARARLDRALDLCAEIVYPRGEAFCLVSQSQLRHLEGDDAQAAEDARRGLVLARQMGWRTAVGTACLSLGHALAGQGELEQAAASYAESLAVHTELGETHRAMEPLAGLARVALARGDRAAALGHVEEILGFLERQSLPGSGEPLRVYLACYEVLEECGDPRAQEVLAQAHALLQEWAARIGDAGVRQGFLANVAPHREIVSLFGKCET